MSPLPLHLVFCCLATYTITEGRIVQGIIEQNVSFSMTFNNVNGDLIQIEHNTSAFVMVWPANNNLIEIQQPDRVSVVIGNKTAPDSVTVIINILNLTKNDNGMYIAIRPWNSSNILDSVLLETNGIDHFTTKVTILIEETTETNHYTTQTLRTKEDTEDTEGINKYKTTDINNKIDAEGVHSEKHLLYVIFAMGVMLAAVFFACLLQKRRSCFRVVGGSTINSAPNNDDGNENIQELNEAGNYWTIVSNAKGEMSTAIETDVDVCRESLLVGPNIVSTNSESEESMRSDDIYVSQEIEGYFNSIKSSTTEYNDYIHPIHSDSLHTCYPTDVSDSRISNMNKSTNREVKSISI